MRLSVRARVLAFVAAVGLVASAPPARADQPLPPPATYEISSGSTECSAVSDAESRTTTAFRTGPDGKKVALWTVPGWYRVAALSADCKSLVAGYDGENLIPRDYDRDLVLLTFHHESKLVREVHLRELVRDLSRLRPTVSHFEWGGYLGREGDDRYRVWTVDRDVVVFDMKTGLETGR